MQMWVEAHPDLCPRCGLPARYCYDYDSEYLRERRNNGGLHGTTNVIRRWHRDALIRMTLAELRTLPPHPTSAMRTDMIQQEVRSRLEREENENPIHTIQREVDQELLDTLRAAEETSYQSQADAANLISALLSVVDEGTLTAALEARQEAEGEEVGYNLADVLTALRNAPLKRAEAEPEAEEKEAEPPTAWHRLGTIEWE